VLPPLTLEALDLAERLVYPPPGQRYWGAEQDLAEGIGGYKDVHLIPHSDIKEFSPVKRFYSVAKLCTAMKAYDCALLKMDAALDLLMKPAAYTNCQHSKTHFWPEDGIVSMDYSVPHTLLVNMPVFEFCAQCGKLMHHSWRAPGPGQDPAVGYKAFVQ
jgi:hypothetical protein